MGFRLAASVGAVLVTLLCVKTAHAEAILTVGGLSLVPDDNGMIQLNVDVDLAGSAPNLVSFDLDVLHAGLSYVGHSIGNALDSDGDLLTTEYFDATLPDLGGTRQNVLAILESGVGATVGRLFSMNFLVSDPAALSLSLLGFPIAQDFEGGFRSESLVSEVAPLDLQAIPFVILLTSNAPGQLTMTLTTPGSGPTDPGDPPVTASEPATLLLFGLGLIALSLRYRRAVPRRTVA
jgi:hypothetical protein